MIHSEEEETKEAHERSSETQEQFSLPSWAEPAHTAHKPAMEVCPHCLSALPH